MMFDRVRVWFRRLFMLDNVTLQNAIGDEIAVSDPMVAALQLWTSMYENKSPWLKHDEIVSLNLAAAISAEIARAVTLEMSVKFSGSSRAKFIEDQFQPILRDLRTFVEYGVAKGGLIFKPYVNNKLLEIDVIQADQFFPVSFDSKGDIQSCVFVDRRVKGEYTFTRLEYHKIDGKSYTVINKAFKSSSKESLGSKVPLSSIDDWAGLQEEAQLKNVEQPLFAYFKYPLANTVDPSSPLGVSCYSRSTNQIKEADKLWSSLLWEFESGQRALYVDVLAFKKDSQGNSILPNKRLYRTLETGSMESKLFEDWSPDLREQHILSGLDAVLKKIEFTSGLAYGTLSDPNTIDKTATEIKISRQRTYATVTDVQKSLERCLDKLFWVMDVWATLAKLAPKGAYTVTYEFGDSILVDKEFQLQSDMRLVTQGIMSKVEFRMRNFNEDVETATKMVASASSERESESDIFGGKNE